MPYSKRDHDRALHQISHDMEYPPQRIQPKRNIEAGIGIMVALAALLLGLGLLLSGCNTIAGIGQDLHDLGDGTRRELADEPARP